ncbi:unnamed protein product, partial [Brassica rapa]
MWSPESKLDAHQKEDATPRQSRTCNTAEPFMPERDHEKNMQPIKRKKTKIRTDGGCGSPSRRPEALSRW